MPMEMIALPFALCFLVFGGYFFWIHIKFMINARPAVGRVLAMEKVRSTRSSSGRSERDNYVYHPVVEYEVDGQKRLFTSSFGSYPPSYKIGAAVPLMISNKQDEARINRIFPFALSGFSIIFGFFLIVLFLAIVEITTWKLVFSIILIGIMAWLVRYILKTGHDITTPGELTRSLRNRSYSRHSFQQRQHNRLITSNDELFVQSAANRWPMMLVGVLFTCIGIGLLVGAVYLGMDRYDFVTEAHRAEGEVIDMNRTEQVEDDGSRVYMYYPIVQYIPEDESKTVTFGHDTGSNPPSYRIGDQVEVLYNPSNPHDAIINAGLMNWFAPGLAGIMGLMFTAAGLFSVMMGRKTRKLSSG